MATSKRRLLRKAAQATVSVASAQERMILAFRRAGLPIDADAVRQQTLGLSVLVEELLNPSEEEIVNEFERKSGNPIDTGRRTT